MLMIMNDICCENEDRTLYMRNSIMMLSSRQQQENALTIYDNMQGMGTTGAEIGKINFTIDAKKKQIEVQHGNNNNSSADLAATTVLCSGRR